MQPSESLTYSTVLIQCDLDNNSGYSLGTGFIMNLCIKNDRCIPVIITNKHVVKDSVRCHFTFCKRKSDGNPNDQDQIICHCGGADGWYMHPNDAIDLCCLPIGQILNDLTQKGLSVYHEALDKTYLPTDEEINNLSAMEDVVMIGYPRGISDVHNNKPILRKGVTGTHIKHDYQNKKEFLIDVACFPGSSGSPVFILNEGSYLEGNTVHIGSRIILVGVLYAGQNFTTNGEIKFAEIPTNPKVLTYIPMNLGNVIKSSEILAFEPMLEKLL